MSKKQNTTEKRARILLVDDNEIDRQAVERLLTRQNLSFTLEMAKSYAEGHERLQQSTYDLILLDYQLGDGTGLDLLQEVGETPAIFITGSGDEEIAVQAIKRGAYDYLIKDPERKYLILLPATIENVLRHKQAEKAMKSLHHRHELILTSAGEGIYGLDQNGYIVFMNPAAEKMSGYKIDELIGLPPDQLHTRFHPRKPDGTPYSREECPIFAAFKDGLPHQETNDVFWRKDGTSFPVEYSSTPMREGDKVTGAVVIFKDITERKKAEKALEQFATELQRSNQDLQDFAFIASHDLQEPLRKVTAFGEFLTKNYTKVLDEKGKDYLNRMTRAARNMKRFMDDLLTLSRVTTKTQPFEPTNLEKIVSEILNTLEMRIEQSGGCVDVVKLPKIDGDKFQLRQLFQNLISNALKFHKKGVSPIVILDSRKLNNGLWEITVEDNGIGFEEKHLNRIFKPFERLRGRSEFEGSGMGLAICQKIVTRHGGTITARSALEKGSTFIVTLPEKHLTER